MDLIIAKNTMFQDVENIHHATNLARLALDSEFPLHKKASSDYIAYLGRQFVIPKACTIMVLIYLRKMRAAGSALTTEEKFSALTLCVALMVAFKLTSFAKTITGHFAHVSGFPLKKLNDYEILFLQAHAWNVHITPEEFAETCAQLELAERAEELRKRRFESCLARCVKRLRIEAADSA
jgi:hypothetical protein